MTSRVDDAQLFTIPYSHYRSSLHQPDILTVDVLLHSADKEHLALIILVQLHHPLINLDPLVVCLCQMDSDILVLPKVF